MKTTEELNALKSEFETLNKKEEFGKLNEKFSQLSEEELKEVSGGAGELPRCPKCGFWMRAEQRPMPGAPGVTYRVYVCQYPYCGNEVRG